MRVTVNDAVAGERLDRIVALESGLSRHDVTDLVDAGAVQVNGRVAKKGSARVAAGDQIAVEMPEAVEPVAFAEPDIDVPIVYDDEHIIVVNKPAGLVVHPGAGNPNGTLVNGLLARYPELAGVGEAERPGIVHRLDGGTSGLMVVARTEEAREVLVDMLGNREVSREYRALAWGTVKGEDGVIEAPIGRSTRERTKMAVVRDGKEARTHYEVRERFEEPAPFTLLWCKLETGRTHQIRVHLAAIGHPVVGDTRYGRARPALDCPRPFLHAERLAFDHPITEEPLEWTTPLPDDLVAVRALLS
ncbi:MAG: RluA family pseudouridine synthase [Acidimicrobiales bacterium]|nr:RluA family pseudouridine synthase [Acidimicrobiales bacterium]